MKKKIIISLFVVIALWTTAVITDYIAVQGFNKPVFCVMTDSKDDGGSGHYVGLGYSFDIEGNFMPEDEFPGVTKWTYYLFGNKLKTGIRD